MKSRKLDESLLLAYQWARRMEDTARMAAALVRAGQHAYAEKWKFLGLLVFIFLSSVVVLDKAGLLPEPSAPRGTGLSADVTKSLAGVAAARPAMPVTIEIPSLDLSVAVANPTETSIAALDAELLKGTVRYPGSARLGEEGNVIIFGHSSYLPVVRNAAYKAFNGIQKLKNGDEITVYSSDAAYVYRVQKVTKEDAETAAIPLTVSGRVLTLATCDSFGEKSDRFVVVADFVESHPLTNS